MNIIAFTDGSCSHNNIKTSTLRRAGAGIFFEGETLPPISIKLDELDNPTNQRSELMATLICFKYLQQFGSQIKSITIKTDSMYVINTMIKNLPKWITNNTFEKKKNLDIICELWRTTYDLQQLYHTMIYFKHVKGHQTKIITDQFSIKYKEKYGNDRADYLAGVAIE